MLDLIGTIWASVQQLPLIVIVCSAVAAMTSTPKDDLLVAKLYKVIDLFALNFGKAKEKNPLLG